MSKKYTYDDFVEIIKTLRSENGCPWDREQTHESLRPCLMEEAAEVLAAIRILKETDNPENLQEELGDVLLQVVMHAQIAKEEGLFTMEDVVNDVATKMVRRHPHVFGTVEVEDSDEVLQNWEEIKKKEKEGKSWVESPLKEIPRELPALTRAPKVLKKADKVYDRRNSFEEDVTVMSESIKTLEMAATQKDKQALETEVGNILMALSDIAKQYKLSMEQILTDRIDDFIEECEN
ncbi:MAG: nucleoside triphosphate pyrophosphohydrolase [Lachnospiraceae bacterium]|nr:nucleoside triphosphate pyrophosphohydrolase [Lachnospiraceae bacterium]